MILSSEENTFYAIARYEEKDSLKQAGFRWNKDRKRWETTDITVASRIVQCADDKARLLLENVARIRAESLKASRKVSSDFNPPCPEGLEYMPFQKAGIEYGIAHPNVLIGDEMGCVDGEAVVDVVRIEKTMNIFIITLAEAHKRFYGLNQSGNWDKSIPTWVRSFNGEGFFYNLVVDILDKGIRPVVRLTLASGKTVRLTQDHEIGTGINQWVAVSDLCAGDIVLASGELRWVKKDTVVSVVPDGEAHVYDIVCEDPHRNFVANGIVVHNCGKTIEAFGVVNSLPETETKKILVISPASLKINWKKEAEKWLTIPRKVAIADSKNFPDTDIVIINYDILKKHHDQIRKITWDILIADEAHLLKSPRALRSLEVLGGREKKKEGETKGKLVDPIPARRKILLSGTPLLNRPKEIFGLAHALAPNEFPDFWKFAMRFCAGHQNKFGWDFSGASHLDELNEKLRSSCLIRRLKSEVLKELPPKRRQIIPLDPEECTAILKAERESYDQHAEEVENARIAVELAKTSDSEEEYQSAVSKLQEANRVAFTEMSRVRHETARAKVPQVIEHIQSCLEEEQKLLIFAHHHDIIEAICEGVGPDLCVKLTGEMKIEDRQQSVDRFQNDPACRVFVGSIKAAGLGITLTAASHVIFAELDWVPSSISQAEDRSCRIGQTKSVLVQHLVFDGSIDADMAKTLVEKQAIIDKALGDDGLDMVITAKPGATENISRKMISLEAINLTPEQIADIHEGLKIIAGMCDGARVLDGAGFSKVDTQIGHDLAERSFLTPKQAVLGKRICTKYRRQLPEELRNRISPPKDRVKKERNYIFGKAGGDLIDKIGRIW